MSRLHPAQTQPVPTAVGIGLRAPHVSHVLEQHPDVAFFEMHSENFFCAGGALWDAFDQVRRDYPVSLHGVGLSLGSADPLDPMHLASLRELVQRAQPTLVSEHVCWGYVGARHFNDLLPLPYTDEALDLMVSHVGQLQDALGRQVLVENVSSYIHFAHSSMPEWEFLAALTARSGCGLLLDVNNVYVNSVNHGFDPHDFIDAMPATAVGELHLAGFMRKQGLGGELLIDTHDRRVDAAVWALYDYTLACIGPKPTLIEWDSDLPEFAVLEDEARLATEYLDDHRRRHAAAAWSLSGFGGRGENLDVRGQIFVGSPTHSGSMGQESAEIWTAQPSLQPDRPKSDRLLGELQRAFAAVLAGDGEGALLQPWITARGIEPAARLRIYRHAGYAIHVDALTTSFPALRRMLGEDCFDGLATRHAARCGSRSGNLQDYGHDFAAFIAAQPETADWPWLGALAQLEWLRQQVALAADEEPADAAALAVGLAGADGSLRLRSCVQVLTSHWAVLKLWNYAHAGDEVDGDFALAQVVLLWREGSQVAMRAIDPPQAIFIEALQCGLSLDLACTAAQGVDAEIAPEALLSPLLEHALLTPSTPSRPR